MSEQQVFAECEQWHHPIYAASNSEYGEEYIEFPGQVYIHVDCVRDFISENKREAVLDG